MPRLGRDALENYQNAPAKTQFPKRANIFLQWPAQLQSQCMTCIAGEAGRGAASALQPENAFEIGNGSMRKGQSRAAAADRFETGPIGKVGFEMLERFTAGNRLRGKFWQIGQVLKEGGVAQEPALQSAAACRKVLRVIEKDTAAEDIRELAGAEEDVGNLAFEPGRFLYQDRLPNCARKGLRHCGGRKHKNREIRREGASGSAEETFGRGEFSQIEGDGRAGQFSSR